MNRLIGWAIAVALCLGQNAALGAVNYKIVTASERGTYIKIGRDLAQFVAPGADIALDAVPSAGSAENVRRLRYESGVKLALVQSDVYQAFLDMGAAGNKAADAIIRPLRVVMPLYNEEIYFIVRADSERNYVHEIRDAKINVGEFGSGTALTTATLYRLMYGEPVAESRATYLSNEEALTRLVTDQSVDVVAVVAGQPAKLLVDMTPQSRQLIKLLKFDANHSSSKAVLKTYFPARVLASNYPNLLAADLPGLAIKALLVTYDFQLASTEMHLRQMARSLCQNFPLLRDKGHPKWREVELALPDLGRGWFYYAPTARELRSCLAGASGERPGAVSRAPQPCSQAERILGLCR